MQPSPAAVGSKPEFSKHDQGPSLNPPSPSRIVNGSLTISPYSAIAAHPELPTVNGISSALQNASAPEPVAKYPQHTSQVIEPTTPPTNPTSPIPPDEKRPVPPPPTLASTPSTEAPPSKPKKKKKKIKLSIGLETLIQADLKELQKRGGNTLVIKQELLEPTSLPETPTTLSVSDCVVEEPHLQTEVAPQPEPKVIENGDGVMLNKKFPGDICGTVHEIVRGSQ